MVEYGKIALTIFRVQGGSLTDISNRSKVLIKIDPSGNVKIDNATLNISMGSSTDLEHAKYFAAKRGGDAKVYSFEVPKWMGDWIENTSIHQKGAKTNPLNLGGLVPKKVDPNQPGAKKFEQPAIWAKWLEESAVPGSGKVMDPQSTTHIKCPT